MIFEFCCQCVACLFSCFLRIFCLTTLNTTEERRPRDEVLRGFLGAVDAGAGCAPVRGHRATDGRLAELPFVDGEVRASAGVLRQRSAAGAIRVRLLDGTQVIENANGDPRSEVGVVQRKGFVLSCVCLAKVPIAALQRPRREHDQRRGG